MQSPFLLFLVRVYCSAFVACVLWLWTSCWPEFWSAVQPLVEAVKKQRTRHPQSPCNCPACSAKHKQWELNKQRVIPSWRAQHSGRGRRKRVETDGYSCNNPACVYYQVTDSSLHALVGCGKHHGVDSTQYFKCQACGTKVTARWNTALYDLKTAAAEVARVMTASSEGVDAAAASRIFAHDERTIRRWLLRTANHAERLHNRLLQKLVCRHLQLDELVTKVRGVKERIWVWVALDAHTKLILVIRCGGRTRIDAQLFVHELWSRLAPGAPPVFTTDGLQQYYYALTAHFGSWVPKAGKRFPVWQVDPRLLYGQLHKIKVGYKLKDMYTQMLSGTRDEFRETLQGMALTGKIMTAYVERVNLTLREHIPALSRRTWSLPQNEQSLEAQLEWGRAYYHFCRYHESLRLPTAKPGRYRSRTPAMVADLARQRWRVSDLLLMPVPPA